MSGRRIASVATGATNAPWHSCHALKRWESRSGSLAAPPAADQHEKKRAPGIGPQRSTNTTSSWREGPFLSQPGAFCAGTRVGPRHKKAPLRDSAGLQGGRVGGVGWGCLTHQRTPGSCGRYPGLCPLVIGWVICVQSRRDHRSLCLRKKPAGGPAEPSAGLGSIHPPAHSSWLSATRALGGFSTIRSSVPCNSRAPGSRLRGRRRS
jgi:hypothetical protein